MSVLSDRFDLGGTPITVMAETPSPLDYFIQGVARDEVTQIWYVSQVMPGGITLPGESSPVSAAQRSINGDLAVHQVIATGDIVATMYLTSFGHGQTLGVEHVTAGFGEDGFGVGGFGDNDAYLWIETDAHMDGTGFGSGRKVARVLFEGGKVTHFSDPDLDVYDPVPGFTRVFPSLDVQRQRVLLTYFDGLVRRYNTYDLDDFKARNFTPLTSIPQSGVQGTLQSCALHGNYVYLLEGTAYDVDNPPPGNTYQVVLDATTGVLLERTLNTQGPGLSYREPEGSTVISPPGGPQLVTSFQAHTPSPRTMAFYSYAPRSVGDDWLFTTPTVSEAPFAWNPLMERFRMDRGVSVVEVSSGVYEQVRYDAYTNEIGAVNLPVNPNENDTDFWPAPRAGLHYFRGGYEHIVSETTKKNIIDSGAAEEGNFTPMPSDNFTPTDGFGFDGFGEGGFGQ